MNEGVKAKRGRKELERDGNNFEECKRVKEAAEERAHISGTGLFRMSPLSFLFPHS